ncbi:hypothetical protein NE237_030796 [Protea cynaroides]|uniref:Agenet domain-containing protein n=1 Tax=Protea cynaroides TaxID=273540 RepID=A0A9Q0GYJ8_9MAGN|nr:hypothetical protein NE237_030796 [Protea cynaroides]
MDNDDNDFQSQSFQLASEDNSKFPGLRSYGLPKFDLDDNLQPHLRFDNLVETEVLLGIQSHEDNQWIEEFSREGSAIEFSSGAAESCSISRHNNVWSEATSSESVEMLLKSVGQDEIITGHTKNEESGACGGVGTLTKQMEPHLNEDGSMPSMLMDGPDVSITLPPEKCHESFSGVDEHSNPKLLEVETTLQTDNDEKPETGNTRDLRPGVLDENWALSVREGNLPIDGRNEDASKRDDVSLVDGAVENNVQNISVVSEGIQVDHPAAIMQNPTEQQKITEGCNEVISYGHPDHVQNDNIEQVYEIGILSKDPVMDDSNSEENKAETGANVVDSPSKLALNVDSAMPVSEGCSKDECSEQQPIKVSERQMVGLPKDIEMGDKSVGDQHEASFVVMEGGINFEGQAVEVRNSNIVIQSSTILKMDSLGQVPQGEVSALCIEKQKDLLTVDSPGQVSQGESSALCLEKQKDLLTVDNRQLDCGVSAGNLETIVSINEDSELFKGQCDRSSNNHVEKFSSSTMELCSSTNILGESQATGNMKVSHVGSRVHGDDHSANDPLSSSMQQVESMQTYESSLVIEPSVVLESRSDLSGFEKENVVQICESSLVSEPSDVNALEKENVRIPTESSNLESETNGSLVDSKGNVSSSQDQDVVANVSVSDRGVGGESASTELVLEVTNLASYNKLDGVHDLPPGNGNASDEVIEQKEDEESAVGIRDFTHLNKKEESVTEMSKEPGSFLMNKCSHVASESVRSSELYQCAIHDNAGQLLPRTSSFMETASEECQDEPRAVMGDKPTQGYSKELETCASVLNGNDGSEGIGVHHDKQEEASLKFDGTMPSNVEMLMQPVPLSLEGSLCVIGKEDQEGKKCGLASEDNNDVAGSEGDAVDGSEISCKPAALSEKSSEFFALEAGNSNLNSDVPNCGSPTIISCNEPSRNDNEKWEGGEVSMDQNASEVPDKEATGGSSSHNPEGNDSEDDRSFTFKINCQPDPSDQETDGGWKPFRSVRPSEHVQAKDVHSPTSSGLSQMNSKMVQEKSHVTPQASDRENVRGGSKGTAEHKTRRSSSKVTDNGTAKEGRSPRETPPVKQIKDRGGAPCNISPGSVKVTSLVIQADEVHTNSYVEGSARKVCSAATVQTSSLPDLNGSASAMFQQPFTDLQQVQLRAQIFVYGSLIQGMAPDEAYMISAFGEFGVVDGGRSLWENAWRVAVEKLHNQKSPLSYPETPVHSHSGARVHEQATRQSPLQNNSFGTPAGRLGNKALSSAIINPAINLSSPLWSVTTPSHDGLQSGSIPGVPLLDGHQTLSPLHSYQSPHVRHYVGNTSPWLSQAPCPGPWVISPRTPALDTSAHFPALPITETSHVTSVRESSVPHLSALQHSSSSSLVYSGVTTSVPAGIVPLPEAKRTASPGKQASADPRPRKKKKSLASKEPSHLSLFPQSQTETVSVAGITNALPTSFAITPPANSVSKTAAGNSVSSGSPIPSSPYRTTGPREMEQKIIFSDESYSNVEQAKQHAEDAAALAASAVSHSRGIWSQLAIQKDSELVSDVEAKLASAAAVAAAAASVAKAAAAAAKVASDAALQAKLMADEALISSRSGNPSQSAEVSSSNCVKSLGMGSPASILKGKDRSNGSSSLIVAAKVASRRRVEAAAAAAKRAENLDAVVKAAELASEAVSQAGAIVAMGDPVPLTVSELVEAGPDGFWKIQGPLEQQLVKSINMSQGGNSNLDGAEGLGRSANHFSELLSNKPETQKTSDQGKTSPKKMTRQSVESHMGLVDGTHWDSVTNNEEGFGGQIGHKTSDVPKTVDVIPESEVGSRIDPVILVQDEEHGVHQPVGILKDNCIKEGSLVEVLSDEDGLRRVWFLAKVLSLEEGKAYVCYTDLLSDEGSGQLKQWVPIEGEGDKAPRIRIAHPMAATKSEGTRKRRRGALGDHVWSVGDRVEAWTRDGWWEGIIMEKSKEDETTLTVHFPAQGDKAIVRVWHLRPHLVWEDGQWVEWRSTENKSRPDEGDTPRDKRPKLGRHCSDTDPVVEARGKVSLLKGPGTGESVKTGDSRPLALSEKEKIFNVGKSTREKNGSDALRTKRTGLQTEGSRVIFGVPKPGKKRKFMEVSKHYVAGTGGQSSEVNDSMKIAKYLIPQGSSRGWKNTSKVDPKGKRVAETKPKMLKSGRTNKNLSGKDSSLTSVVSAPNDGAVPGHLTNAKASNGQDENISEKRSLLEFSSFHGTQKTNEGQTLFSSLAIASDAPLSKKKSSVMEPTQGVGKGKNAPSGERLTKNGEKDTTHNNNSGKPTPDAVEPRRSNRRIQPTSRLLEGLQSSLIVSKIPTVSHDKSSTKLQHRSAASSKGNNHG